jgi:hypothetical protein
MGRGENSGEKLEQCPGGSRLFALLPRTVAFDWIYDVGNRGIRPSRVEGTPLGYTCTHQTKQGIALKAGLLAMLALARTGLHGYFKKAHSCALSDTQGSTTNAQVDCCCWLCRSCRNFGASNNASANSSGGRHGHASPVRMRPI